MEPSNPKKYPYQRTLRIPGTSVDIEVVPDEECEKCDFVICVPNEQTATE